MAVPPVPRTTSDDSILPLVSGQPLLATAIGTVEVRPWDDGRRAGEHADRGEQSRASHGYSIALRERFLEDRLHGRPIASACPG
jgi:hypothetical protein